MMAAISIIAAIAAIAMAVVADERKNRVCKHYNKGDCVCPGKSLAFPIITPCDERCSLCNRATNELRKKDQK